jgi:hypothetical protein
MLGKIVSEQHDVAVVLLSADGGDVRPATPAPIIRAGPWG